MWVGICKYLTKMRNQVCCGCKLCGSQLQYMGWVFNPSHFSLSLDNQMISYFLDESIIWWGLISTSPTNIFMLISSAWQFWTSSKEDHTIFLFIDTVSLTCCFSSSHCSCMQLSFNELIIMLIKLFNHFFTTFYCFRFFSSLLTERSLIILSSGAVTSIKWSQCLAITSWTWLWSCWLRSSIYSSTVYAYHKFHSTVSVQGYLLNTTEQ